MRTLLFLALTTVASASNHPAEQVEFRLPRLSVQPGRSTEFSIDVVIPKDYHIYLRHANKNGHAILTQFTVAGESGFELRELMRPAGIKIENEFALRSKGTFQFELSELGMHTDGKSLQVPLSIRVQICGEGEAAICYMPVTIQRKLRVEVAGTEIQTRDLPDATLPWINSHATALEAAKLKEMNIFALISDPSRCGACAHLEAKILPDPAVNKMLKTGFVTWRVSRNEYSKAQISGSFGIPYYFIVSPDGKILQKWMGAPGAPQFAQRLEPYARAATTGATGSAPAADAIALASCKIPLKQSFAYQAIQMGDFKSSGNMRFVMNNSAPGTYTVLTLDRTGEIEGSYSGRVVSGKLVVESYLGGRDLQFECTSHGITGKVPEHKLQLAIELR